MSVFAVMNRSLHEFSRPMRAEAPHRGGREATVWREAPAPREDSPSPPVTERMDEDCERWDGLS